MGREFISKREGKYDVIEIVCLQVREFDSIDDLFDFC